MRARMPFMREEGGFTTPAAAVALLVVLSLLFVCVHGYDVGTRSGQVQYVADAGALAGDKAVAEFVTAGQVVDAALLTCSLLAVTLYAASAVAAFIPGGAGVAGQISQAGSKVVDFRKKFADSAEDALGAAQEALPALVAVRAAECVEANAEASGLDYAGVAVPFPLQGEEVSFSDGEELEEACEEVEEREETIEEEVGVQEEAQEALDSAKEDGWLADCGGEEGNMRERASSLAGLSGSSNPYYSSAETWSFSAGLARAKAYYAARSASEAGESFDGDPEEITDSVVRKRFYAYALEEVSKGSVGTTASGAEDPDLKSLMHNTDEMKETSLYTESVYPVSQDEDGVRTIHGYTGCPSYGEGSASGTASIADVDAGSVATCDVCELTVSTAGSVASASTNTKSGFEHWYRELVEAAEAYGEAAEELDESARELEEQKGGVAELLEEALSSVAGDRYDPQPPGRYGVVCVVYAPASSDAELPFVGSVSGTPARLAVSAATLAPDPSDDQGDAVADVACGLLPEGSGSFTVVHTVLEAWSGLLKAYAQGTDGVEDALGTVLAIVPVEGTELSSSAREAFEEALESASIEPADLDARKPVVVNSSHVLERDGGSAATALLEAKNAAEAYGSASASASSILSLVSELSSVGSVGDAVTGAGLVVAEIPFSELGSGLADAVISLSAPENLSSSLSRALSALESAASGSES